jgi:RNA polymerase sigma-70 factor (ECF subfamily)
MVGDLAAAEDAVQEACVSALTQWNDVSPANPRAWLIGTARHKALDHLRREMGRDVKEAAAMRELGQPGRSDRDERAAEDTPEERLGLMFMCCHPALDHGTRVALTLRAVFGLTTTEIARVFLVSEPAMSKRLVRGRRKIRESGIRLAVPGPAALVDRLDAVLRVVLLVFTEGHRANTGPALVRGELCDLAISVARELHAMLPGETEVTGMLALLLLTDARRAARTDAHGDVVLLEQHDRSRYDQKLLAEGEALLEQALRAGRPGPYLLQAAIAACHSTASAAADTDWREIAALYGELLRYEPSPVHEANRAIAVAMAEGPAAGLAILDAIIHHPQLARWPSLYVARADLLHRLGRAPDAVDAYQTALQLDPGPAERAFIQHRLTQISSG